MGFVSAHPVAQEEAVVMMVVEALVETVSLANSVLMDSVLVVSQVVA